MHYTDLIRFGWAWPTAIAHRSAQDYLISSLYSYKGICQQSSFFIFCQSHTVLSCLYRFFFSNWGHGLCWHWNQCQWCTSKFRSLTRITLQARSMNHWANSPNNMCSVFWFWAGVRTTTTRELTIGPLTQEYFYPNGLIWSIMWCWPKNVLCDILGSVCSVLPPSSPSRHLFIFAKQIASFQFWISFVIMMSLLSTIYYI